MSTVAANAAQGAALLSGAQDFYAHDDAADNKSGGAYDHRATSFSATEAESWCDFFRAVRSSISFPLVYNTSGANLPAGTAIYPASANAAGIILGLANYSSASAMPIAVLQSSAANGATATVSKTATVTGTDTTAAANGAQIYLGTSGGWTANTPATPNRKYSLGRVGLSAVSGTIYMDVRTPWKGNADDLDDVDNSSKTNRYVLRYNSGSGKIEYSDIFQLVESSSVKMPTALSANGTWCATESEVGTLGANTTFGQLLYLKASDSKWYATDSSANATSGPVKLGFATADGSADANCVVMFRGKIRADSAFPTMTISAPMYVGDSAGSILVTANATSGYIVRVVGHARTADEMYVDVSTAWEVNP